MTPELERALQACASEPIHLSGAIQPHGYLVSCRLPDWTITNVSANVEELTGAAPEAMLRRSLREFITDDVIQAIAETIGFSDPGAPAQRAAVANIGPSAKLCEVSVHAAEGLVHIEIEPHVHGAGDRSPTLVAQAMIARIAQGLDEAGFHERVAEQVRKLTGYDRVMVYRFRHDDSGEVVAESREPDMPSYLGLRYPASDIPPQARRLYLHSRIRVIPDARYRPVPILPDRNPGGGPLDLSQLSLRSVSPVHLEYLANMGVAASMSISIVAGGRLWGLIACHHRTPRPVPAGIRAAADLFGLFVSMRVAAREQQEAARLEEEARGVRDTLAQRLSAASDPRLALPAELEEAAQILREKDEILAAAREEAASIIKSAEDELNSRVCEETVVQEAEAHAKQLLAQAESNAKEITAGAKEYADDILAELENYLADYLKLLRKNRMELSSKRKKETD